MRTSVSASEGWSRREGSAKPAEMDGPELTSSSSPSPPVARYRPSPFESAIAFTHPVCSDRGLTEKTASAKGSPELAIRSLD